MKNTPTNILEKECYIHCLTIKSDIVNWLDKYSINNYTLVPDDKYGFIVDVRGDVGLSDNNLASIGVKFNIVHGDFFCSYNKLTSLESCPKIINGNFSCSNNELTSLEFCPETIGGYFCCVDNKLIDVDMNKVYRFTELYQIHLAHKINIDKEKLEKNIPNKDTKKDDSITISNRKIKI